MKKLHLFTIALNLFFLLSCGSEPENVVVPDLPENDTNAVTLPNDTTALSFQSEKIMIDLSPTPYENEVVKKIMEEVGLCLNSDDRALAKKKNMPLCLPGDFRTFMNHKDHKWEDGFLLEIREGVYTHTPLIIMLYKVKDKYIKVNELKGELLEMRTTPEGRYDLIIRYLDSAVGTVAILHEWMNDHYEPSTVVELNDHFVKEEKMDSLNRVYLDNFAWGY